MHVFRSAFTSCRAHHMSSVIIERFPCIINSNFHRNVVCTADQLFASDLTHLVRLAALRRLDGLRKVVIKNLTREKCTRAWRCLWFSNEKCFCESRDFHWFVISIFLHKIPTNENWCKNFFSDNFFKFFYLPPQLLIQKRFHLACLPFTELFFAGDFFPRYLIDLTKRKRFVRNPRQFSKAAQLWTNMLFWTNRRFDMQDMKNWTLKMKLTWFHFSNSIKSR